MVVYAGYVSWDDYYRLVAVEARNKEEAQKLFAEIWGDAPDNDELYTRDQLAEELISQMRQRIEDKKHQVP